MSLRKLLASASIVAILSTLMVSTAFAASYSDVAEGDVWYDSVEQGATDGVFDAGDKFMPFEAVDRAHMAMYAAKAADLDPVPYKGGFPDVAANHPQADWIQAAVDNGIQKGYDDGNFGPSDTILRGQAAIILKNAFSIDSLEGCAPTFPDLSSDHYAYSAIQDMYCWSVLNGYENGNFGPNDTLVKYQVSIIINNAKYHLAAREVTPVTPVSSGEVTITEGDNMPEAMTVPKGAVNVPFMSFTLTAGSEEADVDGMTFARQGVGSPSDFTNVYIYQGNNRLTSGRSISSDTNTVEFSSLGWNLAPGESQTYDLRADVSTSATASDEHRFYVYSMEGATPGGEVNLAGPYMQIGGQSAGTVEITKNGTLTNPSLGGNGAKISQFKVSASGEDVSLKWINVYLAGSISQNELSNFKLYKGSVVSDANLLAETDEVSSQDTINFDLGDGLAIEDGNEQIFVVTADIDGDAGDTIQTYVSETTDLYAVGDVYGTGSAATITSFDTSAEGHSLTLQGGEITLSFNGPNATDVAIDTQKQDFMDFSLTADRDIEVKQLVVVVTDTSCDADNDDEDLVRGDGTEANFKNIRIMEGDKNMMETESFSALSTDASDCTQTLTFTDSFYVDSGETKDLTLAMDIDDSANGGSSNDTVRVTLNAISTTAGIKDVATNKYISDIVPSGAIVGNTMTLVSSSLAISLASTPVSDTYVKGTKNVPIVGFLFKSGTADSTRVTGVTLTGYMDEDGTNPMAGTGSNNSVNLKDLVNSIRLYEDGYAADKTPITGPKGVESDGTVVFDNMAYDIPASTTKKIVVVGDVSTNAYQNSDAEDFGFDIADVSADVTAEDSDGDTVTATGDAANGGASATVYVTTANSGTLTIATKASETPSSNLVVAGRTGVEVARYEFTATTEDITVNDIDLGYAGTSGTDEVVSISVYDADDLTTPLGTGFVESGIVNLDNLGLVVPADDSAVMVVTVDLNTLPKGADSGDAFAVAIKAVQAASGAAGTNIADNNSGGANDNVAEQTTLSSKTVTSGLASSAAATTFTGTAMTNVSPGSVLLIESEYVLVLDDDTDDDGTKTDYTIARGVWGSTAAVHTDSTAITSVAKASGEYMVVRETKPTFATVPYPSTTKLSNGGGIGIYKFTVDAEAEEDIDLGRIVFKVTGQFAGKPLASNGSTSTLDPADYNGKVATTSTAGLYSDPDANAGDAMVKNIYGVTLYDMTAGEEVDGITTYYQNDNSGTGYLVVDFGTSEEVSSAGKTYELRADIAGVSSNGDYVSVHIPDVTASLYKKVTGVQYTTSASDGTAVAGEAMQSTTLDTAGTAGTIADDVVWSDESATSHSTSSSDWTNGGWLKSLKTVAQTLTFTTS